MAGLSVQHTGKSRRAFFGHLAYGQGADKTSSAGGHDQAADSHCVGLKNVCRVCRKAVKRENEGRKTKIKV